MLRLPKRNRYIAIFLAITLVLVYRWQFPGRSFDSELWQQNQTSFGSKVRLAMADRIVARNSLRGKTLEQVTEMLGSPPDTEYFREWDLVYWLGPERGFLGIDSEWLAIRLDRNNVVEECRILRD